MSRIRAPHPLAHRSALMSGKNKTSRARASCSSDHPSHLYSSVAPVSSASRQSFASPATAQPPLSLSLSRRSLIPPIPLFATLISLSRALARLRVLLPCRHRSIHPHTYGRTRVRAKSRAGKFRFLFPYAAHRHVASI